MIAIVSGHDASKLYMEYYAKMLLETLFPNIYTGIIKSESPDLIMGNHGIEVTWAMFEGQGRASGLLSIAADKRPEDLNPGIRRNIEGSDAQMITRVEDGKIYGCELKKPGNKCTDNELWNGYEKKKQKVKSYTIKDMDLFIYPPLAQLDGWLGEETIKGFLNEIEQEQDNPFQRIIIYEEPSLYVYDYRNSTYKCKKGTKEQIERCKSVADEYSGYSKARRR